MIQKVNIAELKLNDKNPRTISDSKFNKLVASIKKFPKMLDIRPIVVDKDMIVLGGNMRLRACQDAGLKEVPIIIADKLTKKEQREFIIKDNVGFGEWDWESLANEWDTKDLEEWGLDFPRFDVEDEIPAEGRMASTLDEKLDTYLNATIKQIVLYYELEEYEFVLKELDKIAEKNDLPDNSSVIKFLIENQNG
jgi:hypothetical protein